jgi:hypothetical protein
LSEQDEFQNKTMSTPNEHPESQLTEVQKSQIQHAFAYMQQGWHLVMMPMRTKGPNHPGWNSPSELINTPDRAIRRLSQGPQNMGLVHQPSGTCAIDIDDEAWSRHILEEFGFDYDRLLDAGMRIMSKSGRAKVVFIGAPADLPLIKVQWPKQDARTPMDRFTIIEFRAGPNQDVLPPSLHPDGHHYTWAEGQAPWDYEKGELPQMPERLLEFWRTLADRSTGLREEIDNLCPWKTQHIGKRYVQSPRTIDHGQNDVIGAFNRANSLTDLLSQAGYKRKGKRWLAPSSSTKIPGVVVFSDQDHEKCYSHHGSDPLADGYAHDSFDLHCMLFHHGDMKSAVKDAAKQLGLEPQSRAVELMPVDVEDLKQKIDARKQPKIKAPALVENLPAVVEKKPQVPAVQTVVPDIPDFPPHLLAPGGVVQSMMDWILQTAQRPQPILALTAALSVIGTALGRKVASPTNLRTNYYFVGVAGTATGKDHARKCIKELFKASGCFDLLGGEELASGQALLSRAAAHPVSLFQIDEFGLMLKAIAHKSAGPHLASISTNLMKLFSSAGSVYTGTEYADQKMKARVDIAYPCVGLHGTTTPETLWPAMQSSEVVSGYLNRILLVFVPSGPVEKRYDVGVSRPPEDVIDWIKAARDLQCGIMGNDPASPIVVQYSSMARQIYIKFDQWVDKYVESMGDNQLGALWGRAGEHAVKLAIGLACARYSAQDMREAAANNGLEIDPTSMQYAVDLTLFCLQTMEAQIKMRMGDSDFDRQVLDATAVIYKGGAKGRTLRELGLYCRTFNSLKPADQDAVLTALVRRGAASKVIISPKAGGRKREAFVAAEFLKDLDEETGDEQA